MHLWIDTAIDVARTLSATSSERYCVVRADIEQDGSTTAVYTVERWTPGRGYRVEYIA